MEYSFRPPTARPQDRGGPPPRYRRDTADGMIIERDVAVPVRGGVTVYASGTRFRGRFDSHLLIPRAPG